MYTHTSRLLIFFVAISSLGLTGCDNPSQKRQEPADPIKDASMRGFGSPPGDSLTPSNVDIEQISEEGVDFYEIVERASTWKEAHQRVRDQLNASSPVPQFVREQQAAHEMFEQYLSTDRWRESLTQEKVEVLGFYTELLVKNQSPESEFVYAGLQELDGHWSNQRIIDAAETTIQAAEQKYGSEEQSKDSPTNASESDKPTPGLAESRKRRARRALSANRKLQAMLDKKRGGK